ncbi:MAG: hypothetical protein ACE5IK_14110 [Acidobacteriota bacterium]
MTSPPASFGRILRFWSPLASTWLMMSVEGPFLAALIARLADPKENLAAYGVAFAVAIIVESPVIMMLSASTALVENRDSFRKVRHFTYALNLVITAVMLLLLLTPLWRLIARDLIGLPAGVTDLTQGSLLLMIPWPAAIGYRRFFQGLLIRHGLPRRVAYGTIIRVTAMGTTALLLFRTVEAPGAWLAAVALSTGVSIEAIASRLMTASVLRRLRRDQIRPLSGAAPLSYRRIVRFYYPLALTSTISMAAQPIVVFFMGRAPASLESLAILPVVNSFVFIFRSAGLAYQEVAIALLAERPSNQAPVIRFALVLAGFVTVSLTTIAFSPLAALWFRTVSGLSPDLAAFSLTPLRLLIFMPALSVFLSLQRSLLVHRRRTTAITGATLIELSGIIAVLLVATGPLRMAGAVAAAVAFMAGRLGSNLFLLPPAVRAAR